jgi:tagatose-1,6-bisphosphate aldolase
MHLSAISGQNQQVLLLGLDQPMLVAAQLGIDLQQQAGRSQLEEILKETVSAYSDLATGVILSSELGYSAAAYKSPSSGLLYCLERAVGKSDPLSIPVLQPNWSIEYVRNNYAVAKLALYARSDEDELINKLELVNELYDACRYEDIDFLLDLRVIDGKRLSDEAFQEQQLRLIRLFRGQSNLLAVEYPRTALGCLSVTAEAHMPWILSDSDEADYPVYKEKLRNALTGGAVGVSVFKHILPSFAPGAFSLEELRNFLQKEGHDRMLELRRICDEVVK